jgi:hypothetical protein
MPGARCTRGLVCKLRKQRRTRAYRAAETLRHPLRNGFTAYNALSPVNGLVVTVTCRSLHKLDASIAAPGPHDFAVREQRFVRRQKTPTLPASTASHPNAWWRWPTPLLGDETAQLIILICRNDQRNIFHFGA